MSNEYVTPKQASPATPLLQHPKHHKSFYGGCSIQKTRFYDGLLRPGMPVSTSDPELASLKLSSDDPLCPLRTEDLDKPRRDPERWRRRHLYASGLYDSFDGVQGSTTLKACHSSKVDVLDCGRSTYGLDVPPRPCSPWRSSDSHALMEPETEFRPAPGIETEIRRSTPEHHRPDLSRCSESSLSHDQKNFEEDKVGAFPTQIHIPDKIRLRKASEQHDVLTHDRPPVKSVSSLKSLPSLLVLRSLQSASLASTAVTRADITSLPSCERRPSDGCNTLKGIKTTSEGNTRLHSRNSVYEIIWEGGELRKDSRADQPGVAISEMPDSSAGLPALNDEGPGKLKDINRKLSSWKDNQKAADEAVPPISDANSPFIKQSPSSGIYPPLNSPLSGRATGTDQVDTSLSGILALNTATESAAKGPLHGQDFTQKPNPSTKDTTSPYLTTNNLLHPHGSISTRANRRRELLGNRKLSNPPPEVDHFLDHRDSLGLAHRRIHRGGGASLTNQPQALSIHPHQQPSDQRTDHLKHSMWTRSISCPEGDVSSSEDSPPDSRDHSLEEGRCGTKGVGPISETFRDIFLLEGLDVQ